MTSSLSLPCSALSLESIPGSRKASDTPRKHLTIAYGLFLSLAGIVYYFVADRHISSIQTMGSIFKCLAMLLLNLQSLSTGSAAGISVRAVALEVVSLCLQLSATLQFNGYLPVDASGDWILQAFDIGSVALAIVLLARMLGPQRETYCEEADTMPLVPIVSVCFVLGALLHADQARRAFFDAMWMSGLLIGVVAVLPQLWLVSLTDGKIEALTSHFVAMMALSRMLLGAYWWLARNDVFCTPWVPGVNHALLAILSAHVVHMLLLTDFAYVYAKSVASVGLLARVHLSSEEFLV